MGGVEYLYRCEKCGHELTRVYPMGMAPAEITVVNYGSHDNGLCHGVLKRVFTPPNLNNVRRFGTASKRDQRNK